MLPNIVEADFSDYNKNPSVNFVTFCPQIQFLIFGGFKQHITIMKKTTSQKRIFPPQDGFVFIIMLRHLQGNFKPSHVLHSL